LINIRNRDFYEASKSFVIAAINLLTVCIQKGEKIPYIMNERFKIEKEGTCKTIYEQQPIFAAPLHKHRKELENLPEYQVCMKAMTSDPAITKHLNVLVGFYNSQYRRTAEEYLEYLILRQFPPNTERIEFDPTLFDSAYEILERFFYKDDFIFRAMSPLHNFTAEDERIDLDDDLCIRKITIDEQEQLLNEFKWSSIIPHFEALGLKHAIELGYQTKKIIGDAPREPLQTIDQSVKETVRKLVTALRLFKTGLVGYNIVRTVSTFELPLPTGMTSFSSPYKRFLGEKYTLTKLEANEFKKFWERMNKIDVNAFPQLDIALSRFNFAYERDKLEDKLIDFMVAFEALFFKEGESGEFRHKLSVRVSRFLEEEYEQRKLTAKRMNDFYDKRSKVVHGEKVKLKGGFVMTTEDHLRKSIKLFLECLPTSSHDEIITHLDLD
jgi:hypothetical protein